MMHWLTEQLRTTTFLLTLRYMVLFFISLTGLMLVINLSISRFTEARADASVSTTLRTFNVLYGRGGLIAVDEYMQAREVAERTGDMYFMLADSQYDRVAGNLNSWPAFRADDSGWVRFDLRRGGEVFMARGRVNRLGDDGWLLVGREVRDLGGLEQVLDRAFVFVLGATLLFAFAGGLFMSNTVVKRVNEINQTSRQIMGGDLSRRMPTLGTRDEFDQLSNNLNEMLDQIESLMASIRHMSDNVAHDLRTPLTRLRGRLENLRRHTTDQNLEDVEGCLQDAEQLLATFSSLLSITRLESGAADTHLQELDLAEIAADACELYQAVAEEQGLRLEFDRPAPAMIRADRNLVFQALTNLLDNAIKYGSEGGAIGVEVTRSGPEITLSVGDRGPGIPADRREKVLQRFYRLDESRSAPGSGLGLSLVLAIAQRHKAKFVLDDNHPGLLARLVFVNAAQATG